MPTLSANPSQPRALFSGWIARGFCLLGMVLGGGALHAQTAISWAATSDGTWTNGANWTGLNPPASDLISNYASFNNATGVTVTVDGNNGKVAGIEFGSSSGAYILSKTSNPSRSLTLGAYGVRT